MYHVYNRFARGEGVFSDPEEAVGFVELLREVKKRDGLTVFAWALLPNHYHIAVRTSAISLSQTMKHVQRTFSRRFNRRWRRTGPPWQSRYQARLIEDQEYFDHVMVYIHLNPVRAGLVGDPSDYVFSGHREIMGKVKKPLVNVDHALIGFGDTLRKARRSYVNRVKAGIEEEVIDEPSRGPRLLARPDRDLDAPAGVNVDELGRSTGLERPTLEANRFVDAASAILNVEIERLASRRRDSETAAIRESVAAVGIERWGQRADRIAAVLEKHPVVGSRWVARAARARQVDPVTEEKMTRLDDDLSQWALAVRRRGVSYRSEVPAEAR